MEAYELAANLLLNPGEPCWNTRGYLWLDDDGVPHLTARVAVGKEKSEELREAEYVYHGGWEVVPTKEA